MFGHYIKTAFRNLLRNRGYAAINIAIVFILVSFIIFAASRKWLNSSIKKGLYLLLCFGLFYFVVAKFAEVNKAITDAYVAGETARRNND